MVQSFGPKSILMITLKYITSQSNIQNLFDSLILDNQITAVATVSST